tara:strand:- start:443 stop:583 length:141 start_codon:yes stop_codon:yes gene_type:complete
VAKAENLFDLTGNGALLTEASSGLGLGPKEGSARADCDAILRWPED